MRQGTQAYTQALSTLYRLDQQVPVLDLAAQEKAVSATQRGAWRELQSLFESCIARGCLQVSIEPDGALWRIRYRSIDETAEELLEDPGTLSWAIQALQQRLFGEHSQPGDYQHTRFCLKRKATDYEVGLQIFPTVKGDLLQFTLEEKQLLPARLDELGLNYQQLSQIRTRLQNSKGYMLIAGSEPRLLDNVLLALAQEMIEPNRQVLYLNDCHRYALPRIAQLSISGDDNTEQLIDWSNALKVQHDSLLLHGQIPAHASSEIAQTAAYRALVVQTLHTAQPITISDLCKDADTDDARLYYELDTLIMHYPLRRLCEHCKETAALSEAAKVWLDSIRTPATENVIDWLSEGNTERFMHAKGCDKCSHTGYSGHIGVFDIEQRQTNSRSLESRYLEAPCTKQKQRVNPFVKRLMGMVYEGVIPVEEAIRLSHHTN